jgi:hypothetical protein
MSSHLPNVVILLLVLLCLLAPLALWSAVVWWKRRVGLASVFILVAAEAIMLAAFRLLFL